MKKICLIGPVDKRIMAYPLIKLLGLTGKTLIVSDDGNFRKFDDEFEPVFTKGRVDFKIIPILNREGIKEVNLAGYEYVVYVVSNLFIPNCDSYVYCHSLDRGICSENVLGDLESKVEDLKEVLITPTVTKDKNGIKIAVDKEVIAYVWGCEETGQFLPCKNVKIAKIIAYFFNELLELSQDTIIKTLGRVEE